jgi:hypothetical protein
VTRIFRILTLGALVATACSGCAGSLTQYIVQTRNDQGDRSLANGNLTDADLAYRLALRLAPSDPHARAGLAAVQLKIAARDYTQSKFDDALAAVAVAEKYDPESVRLAQLRSEIEQARVKRQIVLSNYPTYKETGRSLRRSYAQLRVQSNAIVAMLQRFDYTYDSNELTSAIRASYQLGSDVARLTSRLENYRQLVDAGAPETGATAPLAPAGSLLPLP